jgi:folate-binding protein YgfZ
MALAAAACGLRGAMVANDGWIFLRSILEIDIGNQGMALRMENTLAGYDEAATGAVVYRVPDPGYLRIGGADRVAYIQRQTTNDVHTLTPWRALLTVLTNGTARILDVWRLVLESDPDVIGAITLPGRGAVTARHLQSRIFFMDKVTVTDASADFAQFEVFGPAAGAVLDMSPGPDEMTPAVVDGVSLRVIGQAARRYRLIVPAGQGDDLAARLVERGAVALSDEVFDVLRIEAGLPGPAFELTGEHTPLETNLDGAISGTKGCYSGQEIIARQITYDKVARRLVGLRLQAPVVVGATVQVDGRTVGTVTSAAESPRYGSLALAVIRRPHFAPQTYVTVAAGHQPVPGETVALPFSS